MCRVRLLTKEHVDTQHMQALQPARIALTALFLGVLLTGWATLVRARHWWKPA